MEQQEKKMPEVISWTVHPEGNATFLIFIPAEFMEQKHVLDLNVMTTACLEEAKANDPTINYVPEREFTIGWGVGLNNIAPSPIGPVNLDGVITDDWKGIDYHNYLEPETHLMTGECQGDLNGLYELKGVNIGVERVVTHTEQA